MKKVKIEYEGENEATETYEEQEFEEQEFQAEEEDDKAFNKSLDDEEKEFNKYLKNKGIDPDDDYHWLSADEQKQLKEEFKDK